MSVDTVVNRTSVDLGVVPTHLKFTGALVPDEAGRLPRNGGGELVILAGMRELVETCPVALSAVQVCAFAGADVGDVDELFSGLKGMGLDAQTVMMVGGVNPMCGDDEDAVVEVLKEVLGAALRNGLKQVNSTSIEAWMEIAGPVDEADYEARLTQAVKLHARVFRELNLGESCIKHWNIEFLRPGEFNTFTSLGKLHELLTRLNEEIGVPFFRALFDAAHCGDSGLSIPENEAIVESMAALDQIGPFHASAKTTRGCLSTDDGWIGAMMSAAARTGKLEQVFVEVFHHEDESMQGLRELDPGHGVDTTDGRSYTQVVADGLVDVTRRLNNLKVRGVLS